MKSQFAEVSMAHKYGSFLHYSIASIQSRFKRSESLNGFDNFSDTIQPVTNGSFSNSTNETSAAGTQTDPYIEFFKEEQICFLVFFLIFIVAGNSIVLLAVALSRRRHSRMHFFIMHLAIADLAVGFLVVLTDLIWKFTMVWHAGRVMCKIVKFAQVLVTFASNYMLVALSIDRYDAIARPLSFTTSWTRCKILVAVVWIVSFVFSLPMLFINDVETAPDGFEYCWMSLPEPQAVNWQIYLTLNALAVFIVPTFIIAGCYTAILYIIWKNSHLLAPSKPQKMYPVVHKQPVSNGLLVKSSPKPPRFRSKEMGRSSRGIIPQAKIRTVKMTFTIVLVFIMCWSPYFIFNLLQVYGHIEDTIVNRSIATFIQSLSPLSNAANPIIYGVFSTRICRYLGRLKVFRSILSIFGCSVEQTSRTCASDFTSNATETERRSPRNTTMMTEKDVEMCDLILSSVKR